MGVYATAGGVGRQHAGNVMVHGCCISIWVHVVVFGLGWSGPAESDYDNDNDMNVIYIGRGWPEGLIKYKERER